MENNEEPIKSYGTIRDEDKNIDNNTEQRVISIDSEESVDVICDTIKSTMVDKNRNKSVDSTSSNESTGYYMFCVIS